MTGLIKRLRSSEGAILITVMLTMAIMATIAVAILENVGLSVRMTHNSTTYNQARWYALSTETWAVKQLKNARQSGEAEADAVPSDQESLHFFASGAEITAKLKPFPNCFNLNSIVTFDDAGALVLNEQSHSQFTQMLLAIGISRATADQLAMSLVDWADTDSELQLNGAEDYDYSGLVVPHRTGNRLLADKSELRAIKGFTRQVYLQLKPLVCAMPTGKANTINVNSLTANQYPLLATVFDSGAANALTEAILSARPQHGYADIQSVLSLPAVAEAEGQADIKALLATDAVYYMLLTEVELENSYVELATLFDTEKAAGASFVRRRLGGEF